MPKYQVHGNVVFYVNRRDDMGDTLMRVTREVMSNWKQANLHFLLSFRPSFIGIFCLISMVTAKTN